jgi:signal transduction histidine kinase
MKHKILVVEDELNINKDITVFLELNNFETMSALNGKKALELLQENIPDFIISDILMPELDGYGLLAELQKNQKTANIPFIFLTAKTDRSDMREGMNLGADDFITKPFDYVELLSAIHSRLKKKQISQSEGENKIEELRMNLRHSLPHEIRNPLNVILGFSELLIKQTDQIEFPANYEMLNHIYSSGIRLKKLFENYLFYSQIELLISDPIELEIITKKVTPSSDLLIYDIAFAVAGKYKRISDLKIEIHDNSIQISQEYFMKIVEELLDNCFKYSPNNSIVKLSSSSDDKFFYLTFYDSGRGITAEQIKRIGAYVQFERSLHEQQGIGLGITIVKKIVELLGGKFSIESEIGKFTKVTVSIKKAK